MRAGFLKFRSLGEAADTDSPDGHSLNMNQNTFLCFAAVRFHRLFILHFPHYDAVNLPQQVK
jgi:hypothetical protein